MSNSLVFGESCYNPFPSGCLNTGLNIAKKAKKPIKFVISLLEKIRTLLCFCKITNIFLHFYSSREKYIIKSNKEQE